MPPEPYEEWLARKNREKAMDNMEAKNTLPSYAQPEGSYQGYAWVEGHFVPYGEKMHVTVGQQETERLRQHVKQLQELLQRQKELTEQARGERDALRRRLNQISDIADQ